MKIIKEYSHYIFQHDKYQIILEINFKENCYNIYNERQEKYFEFGGIKSNRHKTVLKLIFRAIEFAEKMLKKI